TGGPADAEAKVGRRRRAVLPPAPADDARADVASIDAERVTDVLESERPARIGGRDPPLDLAHQMPAVAVRSVCAASEGGERLLEHGEHEALLGLEGEGRAAKEL